MILSGETPKGNSQFSRYYASASPHRCCDKFNLNEEDRRLVDSNTNAAIENIFDTSGDVSPSITTLEIDRDAFLKNAFYCGVGEKYNTSLSMELKKYTKLKMDGYLIFLENWNKTLDYDFLQQLKIDLMLFHTKYNFQSNGSFFKCNDLLGLIEAVAFDGEILMSKIQMALKLMYSIKINGRNLIEHIAYLESLKQSLQTMIKQQLANGIEKVAGDVSFLCGRSDNLSESEDTGLAGVVYDDDNDDDNDLSTNTDSYDKSKEYPYPIDYADDGVELDVNGKSMVELKQSFNLMLLRKDLDILSDIIIPKYKEISSQTVRALEEHLHHIKTFIRLKLVCLESSSKNYSISKEKMSNLSNDDNAWYIGDDDDDDDDN